MREISYTLNNFQFNSIQSFIRQIDHSALIET